MHNMILKTNVANLYFYKFAFVFLLNLRQNVKEILRYEFNS
ncbi:hypothetical protein ERS140167_00421 [Staphylococcus schweitzeri]|nr:hypothetical protein ERS140162_00588 [Staphylococcus schweitzeri]CDR65615.1 hypothetical protein ERS140167_00421 [Staphylococcus schweitzeri]